MSGLGVKRVNKLLRDGRDDNFKSGEVRMRGIINSSGIMWSMRAMSRLSTATVNVFYATLFRSVAGYRFLGKLVLIILGEITCRRAEN